MKKLKVIDDIPEEDELDDEVKTITKPKPKPKEEPKPEPEPEPMKDNFIVIKPKLKRGLFY